MIKRPILLILGAGASMPYGFPSGQKLKEDVLLYLDFDSSPNWYHKLEQLGYKREAVEEFFIALNYSERNSVDEFLEYRTEFLEIGKIAMTLALYPCEKGFNLFNVEPSWYKYFWSKISTSFDNFENNKFSIITFNYDRSIEHYLFTSLKYAYGKSDEECADKIKKISIVHPHGKLGSLPWEDGEKRKYKPVLALEKIKTISEQIIVVSEDCSSSDEFKECYKLLQSAEHIFFLGFGYNDMNLKRLKISDFTSKTPKGTSYGMGFADIRRVKRKYGINLYHREFKIIDILKDEVPWISILD